jgi:hypothetical protein
MGPDGLRAAYKAFSSQVERPSPAMAGFDLQRPVRTLRQGGAGAPARRFDAPERPLSH